MVLGGHGYGCGGVEFIWCKNGFQVAMVMVVVMCVLTWSNMVLRWSRFELVFVNGFKWF